MEFSAAQIAMIIKGNIEGNPQTTVHSFGKIEEAQKGQLAFLANPKYEEYLYTTRASVIILNEDQGLKEPLEATIIRVPDAYSAFATLLQAYETLKAGQLTGIQQPSFIASTAQLGEQHFVGAFAYIGEQVKLGKNVKIHPHVYLGDRVEIGDDCILHPGVKIYHDCKLGNKITIHAGTVIGGDGFGFAPQSDGTYKKVPQIGNVVIEDEVTLWGQVGTTSGITIGAKAVVLGQTGVTKSIEGGKSYFGTPVEESREKLKQLANVKRIPDLLNKLK
jgi:UDP-3-O-[3-hydroxymyristoyl] glucosamine N-acyltransferase